MDANTKEVIMLALTTICLVTMVWVMYRGR